MCAAVRGRIMNRRCSRIVRATWAVACFAIFASAWDLVSAADLAGLVRIGNPVGGHIHPSLCLSKKGTLVATYGHINHRDLRISRSSDGGTTWSEPIPFALTVGKSYYPGSLTTLSSGEIVH